MAKNEEGIDNQSDTQISLTSWKLGGGGSQSFTVLCFNDLKPLQNEELKVKSLHATKTPERI